MAAMVTDAANFSWGVSLIIRDHQSAKDLVRRFHDEKDTHERQKIANQLIREMAVHNHTEELVFYPALEDHLPDGKRKADHSREEHLQMKVLLAQLDGKPVTDPDFSQLLGRVVKEFEKHAKEEEEDIIPSLLAKVSKDEWINLANQFSKTKPLVPTHPHPSAPDKPPAETVVGAATTPVDKARDATREFAESPQEQQQQQQHPRK